MRDCRQTLPFIIADGIHSVKQTLISSIDEDCRGVGAVDSVVGRDGDTGEVEQCLAGDGDRLIPRHDLGAVQNVVGRRRGATCRRTSQRPTDHHLWLRRRTERQVCRTSCQTHTDTL